MKPLKIKRENIKDILKLVSNTYKTYCPQRTKKGFIDWRILTPDTQLDIEFLSYLNEVTLPKSSIKPFFFPQPETILVFNYDPKQEDAFLPKDVLETESEKVDTLLFGVRPCDARSLVLNDMPFKEDPYYNLRRKKIFLVGISCKGQTSTCFCLWTGGSPIGTDGLDIILHPLEDESGYIVEAISERGEELFDSIFPKKFCNEATKAEIEEIEARREKSKGALKSMPELSSQLKEKDLMAVYNAPFWQDIAMSCINCGACTFLCPTCYCFDIQDEVVKKRGRRIRYWDSCMFPLFTQHASGHNPRGDKVKRVRNRFLHKLKYFPERFGPISCVGCGRCIKECPVNIDIREVIRNLLAVK